MRHLIITGTGRTASTLLMQILTLSGWNTGYTKEQAEDADVIKGGLEWGDPDPSDWPEVVKSPYFCDILLGYLRNGLEVDRVIVPIRRLEDAAESRIKADRVWLDTKPSIFENTLQKQIPDLAIKLHRLLTACALYEVPVRFLFYPTWTESWLTLSKVLWPGQEVDYDCEMARIYTECTKRSRKYA